LVDTFVQWFSPSRLWLNHNNLIRGNNQMQGDRVTQLADAAKSPASQVKKFRSKSDAVALEAELVIAAQAGSKEAFEELQKLHWYRLYRTVFSITKNREDAEDVLQDTFFRAYSALVTFEGRSKFGSWLTRIAINTALMSIRKRRARPEIFMEQSSESDEDSLDIRDSGLNPEQVYDQRQRCLGMLRALERLDPKLQAPIRIRTLLECSTKEIAETLDVSVATAKTRLHRGRRRLRTSLALADSRGHLSSRHDEKADRNPYANRDLWIAVLDIIR
jgi:RNA polymerase sigma-70 factor (ECF subfamily)